MAKLEKIIANFEKRMAKFEKRVKHFEIRVIKLEKSVSFRYGNVCDSHCYREQPFFIRNISLVFQYILPKICSHARQLLIFMIFVWKSAYREFLTLFSHTGRISGPTGTPAAAYEKPRAMAGLIE